MVKKEKGKTVNDIPKELFPGDKIVLISEPKEFRKPKYLTALLLGMSPVDAFNVLSLTISFHRYSHRPCELAD